MGDRVGRWIFASDRALVLICNLTRNGTKISKEVCPDFTRITKCTAILKSKLLWCDHY